MREKIYGNVVKFTLPIPPSVNHSHREWYMNGRQMRVPTKKTKDWRKEAEYVIVKAIKDSEWKKLEKTKVIVELFIYWPDKRKRDCHNLGKLIYDVMEGLVYDDDRWVLPRYIDFLYDKEKPRVEITVYEHRDDN